MPCRAIRISRIPTIPSPPLYVVMLMEERGDDLVCIQTSAPMSESRATRTAERWAAQHKAERES